MKKPSNYTPRDRQAFLRTAGVLERCGEVIRDVATPLGRTDKCRDFLETIAEQAREMQKRAERD